MEILLSLQKYFEIIPVPAPMSIAGNTAGVQRKKSKAEQTGRTSSGTNQFNRSMYISPVVPLSNLNV